MAFVSITPTPYQRDLFAALAQRPEVELRVFYMEKAAPDSPWPERPLAPYEKYLAGFWLGLGTRRVHFNWPLGDLRNYDVVVVNALISFTAQWLTRVTLRGRKWIFWGEKFQHSLSRTGGWSFQGWLKVLLLRPLHRAAGLAGIGRWALEDYQAAFPRLRHFNIPYHCDLEAFLQSPRRPRTDGLVVFLFCGQMIRRKGLDNLLEAFAQLDGRAHLLLVGREAELPQLLAALPVEIRERIEYAGFQAPEALPTWFARADVFVLPSRYDGWGVVMNQALAAGLPIICSDQVGAGYDLVKEGCNGRKFPAGDALALRDCLQHFLDEPARIDEYGEASRARAAEWQPACGAAKWVAALQAVS